MHVFEWVCVYPKAPRYIDCKIIFLYRVARAKKREKNWYQEFRAILMHKSGRCHWISLIRHVKRTTDCERMQISSLRQPHFCIPQPASIMLLNHYENGTYIFLLLAFSVLGNHLRRARHRPQWLLPRRVGSAARAYWRLLQRSQQRKVCAPCCAHRSGAGHHGLCSPVANGPAFPAG